METRLHEEFARDYPVEGASNKRFGFVVGGIALLFGCVRAGGTPRSACLQRRVDGDRACADRCRADQARCAGGSQSRLG